VEASDHVDLAVPAADRLGGLVPSAGHLVHMPAHIYMRVGRYRDAVDSNIRAIAADEDYITQCRAQGIYPAAYYPHNIHFLNAALMMSGRSREAIESARKVAAHHDHQAMREPGFAFAHLLEAIPVLTLVRFGKWEEILKEPQPPADQPFGRAMWHFARGFALKGAAAGAELGAVRKLVLGPSLAEMKIFDQNSLADIAKIAVAMLEGQLAGNNDAAVAAFRRAVQLDDNLRYSEPPDWPLPPRHYLAAALLAAGKSAEAEKVYREDLKRHRANGWSLAGLARSLEKQGQDASVVRAQLEKAWSQADFEISGSRL
jgi:tetratricopeptide (TPR) repeat protein